MPECRDGFLKEYSYYQQKWTYQVFPTQETDDKTDNFENCAVWDLCKVERQFRLTLENEIVRLSRNVGTQPPLYAA